MAPNNFCANVPRPTDEERERDWPQVQANVSKAVKARIAECGLEDE